MRVILHADDFGFDKDTTNATIELLEKGILTSASIMVNMPASDMAISYAKAHSEKSWGVHLTFVDGLQPCIPSHQIPTLVNKDGVFHESDVVRKRALFCNISKKDIVKESIAQISRLREVGIHVSHLDSHGHLHKFPSFLFAMKRIADESGIRRIRRVQNVFINSPHFYSPVNIVNKCLDNCIVSNFRTTDYFYMSANAMDTHWAKSIYGRMNALPDNKVIEIGVHPGYFEEWRKQELIDLSELYQLIGQQHEIINWNFV